MFLKLLKVLSIAVIVVFMGTYVGYLTTGQLPKIFTTAPKLPDLSLDKIKLKTPNEITSLIDKSKNKLEGETKNEIIYKWRDANGRLHYTNEKPPANVKVELIEVDPNMNIMPAQKVNKTNSDQLVANSKPSKQNKRQKKKQNSEDMLTSDGINSVLDKAKNVQKLIDERAKQQEEIFNDI